MPILTFTAPGEVASVKSHGTELLVATSHTHGVHAGSTDLGHGRGSAGLIQSLLLEVGLLATGSSALVSTISGDTHCSLQSIKQK